MYVCSCKFASVQLGYTPLHQAAQQGKVDAVKALLKHRADPNALTAVSEKFFCLCTSPFFCFTLNEILLNYACDF